MHRLFGGDVLEHNLQLGMAVPQWCQVAFDEHRLSVEDIDLTVRDFTMDQQGHADPGQSLHSAQIWQGLLIAFILI